MKNNAKRMKALVIEDARTTLSAVSRHLERIGIAAVGAPDGEAGIAVFARERPDLVLLDIVLPGMDGYEVAQRIRAMERPAEWAPIIFLTARTGDEDVERGIEAGGDDYLVKPVSGTVLMAKVRAMQRILQMRENLRETAAELSAANRELKRLSAVDGLTGVANRRQFDDTLRREWRRAQRTGNSLALLLADVDHFKAFNDHLGHQAGDECLRAVARALEAQARRSGDLVARYGGEEFAVVLADTDAEAARAIAERMREAVQLLGIAHPASQVGRMLTLSIGAAACRVTRATAGGPERLIQAADSALYMAKNAGRNRAVGHPTDAVGAI